LALANTPVKGVHELGKLFEEIARVMGSGASLRMILNAERRYVVTSQPFESPVVQANVGLSDCRD